MSHQDVAAQASAEPKAVWIEQFVQASILKQVRFRKTARWSPLQLVTTAVLWGLGEAATLGDRFVTASSAMGGSLTPGATGISFQAFCKLLVRWTPVLITLLMHRCRQRIGRLNAFVDQSGFVIFGIDGTRLGVPRTQSNEQAFAAGLNPACRRRGRHRRRARIQAEIPSVWLTMIWHIGTGLPWLWRIGKANASERDHLRRMISALPAKSLLVADAGYAGYEYWKLLLEHGTHLMIRVGSGISLLKQLGRWERTADRVWLWPQAAAGSAQPPLKLRLVHLREGGKHVWLVTSVLSQARLSDQAIGEIYRRRWGVEVFFRDFKQTLQRRKLLSRTPEHVVVELHWSLCGLTLALLQAKLAQQKLPAAARTSVSGVLRVLRQVIQWGSQTGEQIRTALRSAVTDTYVRRRKSRRRYPRRRGYKPPGQPQLINASHQLNALSQSIAPLTLASYG